MLALDYRNRILSTTIQSAYALSSANAWEDVLLAELELMNGSLYERFRESYVRPLYQLLRVCTVRLADEFVAVRVTVQAATMGADSLDFGQILTKLDVIRVTAEDDWRSTDVDVLASWKASTSGGLNFRKVVDQHIELDIHELEQSLRTASDKALSEWNPGAFAALLTHNLAH